MGRTQQNPASPDPARLTARRPSCEGTFVDTDRIEAYYTSSTDLCC